MRHRTRSRFFDPILTPSFALLAAGVLVLTACQQDTMGPSNPEDAPALAASSAGALTFRMVATGGWHTCGVTTDNVGYCWGLNRNGELGDGTLKTRSRPVLIARGLRFLQVSGGYYHTCGLTIDNLAYCWGSGEHGQLGYGGSHPRVRPVPVTGGLRFRQVSVGAYHSCGLTTDDRPYCWGWNYAGQLGDGTTIERKSPVPVAGGLRFRRIKVGGYTCGLTIDGQTYCWGGEHLQPRRIPGGISFTQVSSGCGLTAERRAYCWSGYGEPEAVPGGLEFNQLGSSGRNCGVTTEGKAYCWGDNFTGALGDGTETNRTTPTAVLGGLLFSGVSPGLGYHTCGVTRAGRAYCWGHNPYGQLGTGSNTGPETCGFELPCSRKPVAVVGPA